MGLVLKHVEQTKSGGFQYRRRVPKDISTVITRREFKRKLGDSEREALKAWPERYAPVEREIAEARRRISQGSASPQTDLEAYAQARQQVRDMAASGVTRRDMQSAAEGIISRYPVDPETDTPIGASPVDAYAINLLRGGRAEPAAPEPTLNDALGLYCREHLREDHPETDSRVVGLAKRVVGSAIAALGGDARLSSITREDARNVRDHMLDRVKETGRGVGGKVNASTVSRELSIVAAVFNFAVREFSLPATVQNPFGNLPVARVAKGKGQKASEKRAPLPADILKETRARVLANGSPELALIWRLIEGTGCRIAEVTGLQVGDVSPDAEFPFVRIEPNAVRSHKTESSRRVVPLVGDALGAAKEALKLPREGETCCSRLMAVCEALTRPLHR